MASFSQGTAEEVKSGAAQFRPGAIVSKQQATFVGRKTEKRGSRTVTTKQGTKIYHRAVTYVNQNEDGTVSGGDRVIYIEKNGTFQPAAVSKDGGKTYSFSDPDYPTMDGVAGAVLQNELNTPDGAIHKNLDAQINRSLDDAGIPKTQKKKLIDSIKNNADQTDDDSTPVDTSTSPLVSRDIPGRNNARPSFGNYIYPIDLGKTKQDVIKFTMLEYVPKDFNQSGQFGFSDRDTFRDRDGKRNAIGTVILPIPGGIQDNNSVSWAGQNMNALEAGLANVALNTIERGVKGAGDATKGVLDALKGGGGEAKTAIANAFAGMATGTGGQLLARTTGAVINPNLELLFSGPSLRTFSFSFKMNAREKAESDEIVKIIRFFKQGSAVQRSASQLFLKSPHSFGVQYLHRGPGDNTENRFMGRIKECALQSVGVNYTPENNYATFEDGAMVSYQVTLNFGELEPVFYDDFTNIDRDTDTHIGF